MACARESPPTNRLTSDFGNLDLSSIDRDEHMSTAPQSSEIDSTSPASIRLKPPTRVSIIRQHAVNILHACNYDVHLIDITHGKDEFYAADGTTKTNFLRCGITPDPDTSSTIRDSLSESVTPIPSNRRTRARVQSISDQPHNPRTQTADKHVGTSPIKNPVSSVPTILQPNSYNRTMLVVVMESRDKNQLLAFDTSQEVLFSFGDIIAISTVTLLVNRASDGMIASYTIHITAVKKLHITAVKKISNCHFIAHKIGETCDTENRTLVLGYIQDVDDFNHKVTIKFPFLRRHFIANVDINDRKLDHAIHRAVIASVRNVTPLDVFHIYGYTLLKNIE